MPDYIDILRQQEVPERHCPDCNALILSNREATATGSRVICQQCGTGIADISCCPYCGTLLSVTQLRIGCACPILTRAMPTKWILIRPDKEEAI